MPAKRIIPCLDVTAGRVVKGTRFLDLRDAGDPVELAAYYDREGADELVFLDITATSSKRDTVVELARRTADEVFVPFTIGGGIRSERDAQAVLDAGADKVSVNSAALQRPQLIDKLARVFGSQCVVLAIDAKAHGDGWEAYVAGGRTPAGPGWSAWASFPAAPSGCAWQPPEGTSSWSGAPRAICCSAAGPASSTSSSAPARTGSHASSPTHSASGAPMRACAPALTSGS